MNRPPLFLALEPVIEVFESLSVPYYVGGSVASSAVGTARTTLDVDLVADLRAAQQLRYRVFVNEMGAKVPAADAEAGIERDEFDAYFDHLLLIDKMVSPDDMGRHVVGVYRLLRDEVARATRLLAKDVAAGKLDPSDVNEETLTHYLDTRVLPDPDLVIRTSGETRISNYLLWQSAYAEYEFSPTLWPDFSAAELAAIIGRYAGRDRRFGAAAPA